MIKTFFIILMALHISIDRPFHRNDSTIFPVVTISSYENRPFIQLADWQYLEAPSSSFPIFPNNRSMIDCPVRLRDCFLDVENWDIPPSEAGHVFGIDENGTFLRSGGTTGWEGFYYTIPLVSDVGAMLSIQATATTLAATGNSSGIALVETEDPQDFPYDHNYSTNTNIKHAMIFGQNGQLTIREATVKPKSVAGDFAYEVGDTGMIKLDSSMIVRYYLIKPDGRMILLRTTRSKLTTAPTPEVMLYADAASLSNVLLCHESAGTTFENIGVARREKGTKEWQKWENSRTRISNADPIVLADGESEYTFPSSKKVLRQYSLTPKTFNNAGFQDFEDFFNWHGNEKNFIFIDAARKDIDGNKQEFWARFASGFTDTTKNACIFEHNVPIIEAYRGDFIPRVTDEIAPEISLAENSGSGDVAIFIATATDNQAIAFVRFFIDGRHIYNLDVTSTTDEFQIGFGTVGIGAGTYGITAVAYDIAGNTATSETRPLVVA